MHGAAAAYHEGYSLYVDGKMAITTKLSRDTPVRATDTAPTANTAPTPTANTAPDATPTAVSAADLSWAQQQEQPWP